MEWYRQNTSLNWCEEENNNERNNTLAWFEPAIEAEEADNLEEIKEKKKEEIDTAYFKKKTAGNNTEIPVDPEPVELSKLVRDYENWEGRVVSTEEETIIARIFNTQRIYSPRIMQISKSVFASRGISQNLSVGDMFELTFKHVRIEFKNKEKELTQREENIDTIRLIEQVNLTRREIDDLVSKELQALSYLFK